MSIKRDKSKNGEGRWSSKYIRMRLGALMKREKMSVRDIYIRCDLSIEYRTFKYFMDGKLIRLNYDDGKQVERFIKGRGGVLGLEEE